MLPDLLIALILGIVEGLTEFLPVSSTGHMILVGQILQFTGDRAETFEVFIQLGAILAVLVLYWKRFLSLLDWKDGMDFQSKRFAGARAALLLGCACLPAFVTGFLFHKAIKTYLFAPLPVALALLIGGLVMLVIERICPKRTVMVVDRISPMQAFVVGLFQCLALWPGMSRSASTIIGGLAVGIEKKAAAEFSFLVAVPVMCAATGYDLLKSIHFLSRDDIPLFAVGFIVSFVTAMLAIRVFLQLLERFSLAVFGVYRIILAVLVLIFLSGTSL